MPPDDCVLISPLVRIRFLEFFLNSQSLMQTYSSKEPKIILAVPASLSHGPSRSLFTDFAAVADNVVLLTSRGEEGTLARMLFDRWNDSQRDTDKWDRGKIGSNIMMDGVLQLNVRQVTLPCGHFILRIIKDQLQSTTSGCRVRSSSC